MSFVSDLVKKWRLYKEKSVIRRSKEIFTIDDYNGRLWFICNGIGMFPCSFVGTSTEKEIIEFLNDMRKFYIETEQTPCRTNL